MTLRALCLLSALAPAILPAQTPPAPASAPAPVPIESLAPRPALSTATLAKLAQLTPIFDGKSLTGWHQAPVAPFRFAREDIPQPAALAQKLSAKAAPLAAHLVASFDDAGRAALVTLASGDAANREATSAFFRNLNALTAGPLLYAPDRFESIARRPDTDALRKTVPTGLALARLNRLLLEDAFPSEIVQSPASGWIVKDGALASTGASRGSLYTAADYTHYRLVFQVRQLRGNHVPGVLLFCTRPATRGDLAEAQAGIDALGGIQFQVPNGGHWDYRPGINKAGASFTRPVRIRYNLNEWAQVEILVNAKTGVARMAVAQPIGTRGIENLVFQELAAGKPGPIALQMHNAGLFDEFRDLKIELDPKEDRLLLVD